MPGDPELLNNLANALLNLKLDAGRAVKLSEEAVALATRRLKDLDEELSTAAPGTQPKIREDIDDSRFRLFYYLGTLGQALEADGKFEKSVEVRERSFTFAPEEDPDGVARRHLETALLLRKMGVKERADLHLRKAREKSKDPALQKRIDEVKP
jgi:tetratricopeptide (TPR) repeat protein